MPDLSGFNLSGANLIGNLLFSSVGFVAFIYGKKMSVWKPALIGIALMTYPYFVADTMALYAIGVVLSASLYFLRD